MDSAEAEEAYRKYGELLVRYAAAIAGPARADDVVHEAMVRVLRNSAPVANTKAFLYRSVHNAAVDVVKSASRREAREIRANIQRPTTELDHADLDVLRGLASLSPRQRSVMWLTYWEDLTPSSVSQVLGISEGSVKQHLARGRAAMKEVLS